MKRLLYQRVILFSVPVLQTAPEGLGPDELYEWIRENDPEALFNEKCLDIVETKPVSIEEG